MSDIAFVFPGQGSQKVGMLADLIASEPLVAETFSEASEVLGFDITSIVLEGPEDTLNMTQNTQPVLLAASVALWRLWCERQEPRPSIMAGHSLGEYSALVCAGTLSFSEGLQLVRKRGQYMQEAVPAGTGAMAAVIGLEDATITEVCDKISAESGLVLSAVNFNAPGQVVVAGNREAVDGSLATFKEAGARKVVPLSVSVPSHCALMKPAAERLVEDLSEVSIEVPKIAVVQNVSAEVVSDPALIRENLILQLYSPVRWVESVQAIASTGVEALYECGPGKVLAGLNKRIVKGIPVIAMDCASAFDAS